MLQSLTLLARHLSSAFESRLLFFQEAEPSFPPTGGILTTDSVNSRIALRFHRQQRETSIILIPFAPRDVSMNSYFALAGILAFALGLAHSIIGELLLIGRLNKDNLPALGLYRGWGFRRLAVRPGYYGGGKDAIVLVRSTQASDEASPQRDGACHPLPGHDDGC